MFYISLQSIACADETDAFTDFRDDFIEDVKEQVRGWDGLPPHGFLLTSAVHESWTFKHFKALILVLTDAASGFQIPLS